MTDFLKEFIDDILDEYFPAENFLLYYYKDFNDVLDIYIQIPDEVEGVVISGSFPAQVIRTFFPDSPRIITEFNNDDLGVFQLFFELLYNHRDLQLNRVYADVLDVGNISLADYLLNPLKTSINTIHKQAAAKLNLEELIAIEQNMLQKHIQKWQAGEIDFSVTRFSSIVRQLEEAGLKVHFAYPDRHFVKQVIESLQQQLTIRSMQQLLPAYLWVSAKGDINNKQLAALGLALDEFFSVLSFDALVKQVENDFSVITQRRFIAQATSGFVSCALQPFLRQHLSFPVDIGYGLGDSLYDAKINAMHAHAESRKHDIGTSSLMDQAGRLTSPLSVEGSTAPTVPAVTLKGTTPWVRQLSKQTGISQLNIQKLIAAGRDTLDNTITSQEIAYKLRITRRSANRLLSALKKSGLAVIVDQKQGSSQGRPERVYQLNLNSPNKDAT